MKKFNNILLPTDFSNCSKRAADEAFALARRFSATSHLLYASTARARSGFWPGSSPYENEILLEPETAVARDMSALLMGSEIDENRLYCVQVRGVSETGSIVSYARENPIDLIVMGAHGQDSVNGEDAMGSVTRDIIASAPCPVITLREDHDEHLASLNAILVPIDFSVITEATLAHVADLARAFGSTLQLLHVVSPDGDMAHALGAMAGVRDRLREKLNGSARVEVDLLIGDPAREITRFAAEKGSDLIFITREDVANQPIMGRITEQVFNDAVCPVYVAPISA